MLTEVEDRCEQALQAFESKGVATDEVEITEPSRMDRVRALSPISVAPTAP